MILDYFQDKKVVVTGAAGFVGSHLCDRLLLLGAEVLGLDNLITGNEKNLDVVRKNEKFKFELVDVNDQVKTLAILAQQGKIDVILHFASPASPPLYQKYPTETYLVNTLATHNLLTWLKTNQPAARFLFASTSEVYGDPQVHPQVESYWGNVNPNGVRSCYDEAKRLGETICGVFARDLGMDTRLVRIFNTYGPRMDLNDGRVLPEFIKKAKEKQKLTVYGEGKQTRSYCYVADLVEGILSLAASDKGKGETVNLGNPGEFSILETAEIFNEMIGREKGEIEYLPLPQDDPTRRQPNIDKARELLEWAPKVAFREGLRMMLESYEIL